MGAHFILFGLLVAIVIFIRDQDSLYEETFHGEDPYEYHLNHFNETDEFTESYFNEEWDGGCAISFF